MILPIKVRRQQIPWSTILTVKTGHEIVRPPDDPVTEVTGSRTSLERMSMFVARDDNVLSFPQRGSSPQR